MHLTAAHTHVDAEHGVVYSLPRDFYGYFAWPTVARAGDGTLYVGASGLRNAHVCPFGRNVLLTSQDDGCTWTAPAVVNDSPLDDRDTGVLCLDGDRLLISWFSTDTRRAAVHARYLEHAATHVSSRATGDTQGAAPRRHPDWDGPATVARYRAGFARMTDTRAARWTGSWVRASTDGGETWAPPLRVPVTAPHGPILLRSSDLLYLGKEFTTDGTGPVRAIRSADGGASWQPLGAVPLYPGTVDEHYHEPHAIELDDGTLLGLIRFQDHGDAPRVAELGLTRFSLMGTRSHDGGRTWTRAAPLGVHGAPPHLLRHSSGAIVCVYGYRLAPYGQRAMISRDGGETWSYDHVLRDDGPDADLGYPSSVELGDGSVLTVYYQKPASAHDQCALLWTRWTLP